MKKSLIISIAAILVAVISLGAVGFLFWDKSKEPNEELLPETEESTDADISVDAASTYAVRGVRMMAAAPMTVSEETLSQTLTATVLPATASNKAVDWSVAWAAPNGDFEKGKNVTDYVTVTPSSNGSTTATVTAHKAFAGAPVVVTVTTRAGGYKAESVVTYVGIPSVMQIADNGEFDAQGRYAANAQAKTSFNIDLNNVLGVVTDTYRSDYADFEIVSVEAHGSFVCSGKVFNNIINIFYFHRS